MQVGTEAMGDSPNSKASQAIKDRILGRNCGIYLIDFVDLIGIEEQLLQTPGITQNVLRHGGKRTVSFVDIFHLPIASLNKNGNTTKHFAS